MKSKRFLSFLLALVMVFSLLSSGVFAQDTETNVETEGQFSLTCNVDSFGNKSYTTGTLHSQGHKLNNSLVFKTEAEAIEFVRSEMEDRETSVVCTYYSADYPSKQEMHDFMDAVTAHTGVPTQGDYLEFQFGGWGMSWGYSYDGSQYRIELDISLNYYTDYSQEQIVDELVDNVLDQLDLTGMSDYDKIFAVYRFICENVTYDYENVNNENYSIQYTAYGALADGTAVCQGYANLFYRLALELGVDCRIISGIGNGGGHAWNIVKLGDRYYNLDSTWDAGYAPERYDYFLRCNNNFYDHSRYSQYTTAAFNASYPMSTTDYQEETDSFVLSGTCGANLSWAFDAGNGYLKITGSGAMTDYGFGQAPWYSLRDYICAVELPIGLTDIGSYAFFGCNELTDVYYQGSETKWKSISIEAYNKPLTGANIHYDGNAVLIGGFVDRLYETCMGRLPDADGRAYWIGVLQRGEVTGTHAAYGFIFSPEFKKKNLCNYDFLKQLYVALMGRQADQEGLDFWYQEMLNGMTREDVFNRFAKSKEFTGICQRYGIVLGDSIALPKFPTNPTGNCSVCGVEDGATTFVKRLYTQAHGRQPDQEGLNYWVSELRNHYRTGSNVAYGFIFSKEFENKNYNNEQFLTKLYLTLMGRNPDEGGMNYYLAEMEKGLTRKQTFDAFVRSKEFTKICNKFGILR